MRQRRLVSVALTSVVLAIAACAPPARLAASHDEYFVAACAAWDSLFRAVGNPDTGSGSDLSRAMDAAFDAGNTAAGERAGEEIAKELRAAREHAAVAAGWQPRAAVMAQFDRVLVAYQVRNAAKVAVGRHEPTAIDPQLKFEQAGGLDAWMAMVDAMRAAGGGAATDPSCANTGISP